MLRKIAITAGIVLVLGIAYFFVSDITRKDVIAANNFSHEIGTEPLRAGDVVVLDDRGGVSKLCDAQPSVSPAPESRAGLYFNRSSRILRTLLDAGRDLGLLPSSGPLVVHGSLPFDGGNESLEGAAFVYANPEACECDIARSLARGERVCTVSASLIETGEVLSGEAGFIRRPIESRTVAVTLRRHVVTLAEETFPGCRIDIGEARVTQQRLCDSNPRLPLDVWLRLKWNLIDHEPLSAQEARLGGG